MRIFLQFLDLPTSMKENTEFWLFALKYKSDGSRRQVVKMIVTFSSLAAIVFRLLHRTPVVQYMIRFNRLLLSGVTFLISRNRKLKQQNSFEDQ